MMLLSNSTLVACVTITLSASENLSLKHTVILIHAIVAFKLSCHHVNYIVFTAIYTMSVFNRTVIKVSFDATKVRRDALLLASAFMCIPDVSKCLYPNLAMSLLIHHSQIHNNVSFTFLNMYIYNL